MPHASSQLLALSLLVLPATTTAQEPPVLRWGDRVRIEVRRESPRRFPEALVGRLVSLTPDTITVATRQDPGLALPIADVVRVEVGQTQQHVGRGAGIGLLAGLGIGALVGLSALPRCTPGYSGAFCFNAGAAAGIGAAALALPGVLLGPVVGAVPHEHWESLPLGPSGSHSSVGPARLTVGASLYLPAITW